LGGKSRRLEKLAFYSIPQAIPMILDITKPPCYIYYDRYTTTDVPTSDEVCCRKEETPMNGISSDVIRGYNDTMILYLLMQKPSYGYEITKQIRSLTNEKYIIKETTLYSAFSRMEKNGYINSFPSEEVGGKRRTYYRITEAGIAYYREKCEEWLLTKEVVEKFVTNEENQGGSLEWRH
jgi:PadR family transcriptional regulator PadR